MYRILIVEDDKVLLRAIEKKIAINNFTLLSCDNVPDAIEIIKNDNVDVIWLDHYLVGQESGLDLVTFLKKDNGPWKNIPVFIVSNTASPEKVKAYIRLGVEKYYTKSDTTLKEIIEDILKFLSDNNE